MIRLLCTLLISLTAIIITALWNTSIGKVICIIIASWIAINIFGLDITDLEALKESPEIIADIALGWFI